NLTADKVSVAGKGPADPIAPNATAKGRGLNRRVEVTAYAADTTEMKVLKPIEIKSGPQTALAVAAPESAAHAPKGDAKPALADGLVSPAEGELLAERVSAV